MKPEEDIEKPLARIREILEEEPPKDKEGKRVSGYDSEKETEDKVMDVKNLVHKYFCRTWSRANAGADP